jgi:hypothetical protein
MEVECEPLIPALDLLKKEPWVSEAAVFGDGLHVIGKEGAELEREIRGLFEKHEFFSKGRERSDLLWRMFLFL